MTLCHLAISTSAPQPSSSIRLTGLPPRRVGRFVGQVSRGDGRARRPPHKQRLDDRELDVGDDDIGGPEVVAQDVCSTHIDPHAVPANRLTRHLNRDRIEIHRRDRIEPETHSRDRHDAGATPGIEQTPALEPGEEFDACTGRRVLRAGAEGAAGIDDDDRLTGRRWLPGWADQPDRRRERDGGTPATDPPIRSRRDV